MQTALKKTLFLRDLKESMKKCCKPTSVVKPFQAFETLKRDDLQVTFKRILITINSMVADKREAPILLCKRYVGDRPVRANK